jgi:hypothetical protein
VQQQIFECNTKQKDFADKALKDLEQKQAETAYLRRTTQTPRRKTHHPRPRRRRKSQLRQIRQPVSGCKKHPRRGGEVNDCKYALCQYNLHSWNFDTIYGVT